MPVAPTLAASACRGPLSPSLQETLVLESLSPNNASYFRGDHPSQVSAVSVIAAPSSVLRVLLGDRRACVTFSESVIVDTEWQAHYEFYVNLKKTIVQE